MVESLSEVSNPFLLFLAIAVMPLVGVPAGALWTLTGAALGPYSGTGIAVSGLLANILIAHRLTRLAGRVPFIRRYYAALNERLAASRVRPFDTVLLVRTMPGIPLFVQNYFLGSLEMPFVVYLGTSLLLQSCYAVGFVLLGASLRSSDWTVTVGLVIGVVLLSLGLRWLARTRERAALRRNAPRRS